MINSIFMTLFLITLFMSFVGLIKPHLALFKTENKTRTKLFRVYTPLLLILFLLVAVTIPELTEEEKLAKSNELLITAQANMHGEEYYKAEEKLEAAIDYNPNSSEAVNLLLTVKDKISQLEKKEEALQLIDEAKTKIENEDFEKASAILEDALGIYPDFEKDIRILEEQIQVHESIIIAEEETKKEALSKLELAVNNIQNGKYEQAIEKIKKAISLDPDIEKANSLLKEAQELQLAEQERKDLKEEAHNLVERAQISIDNENYEDAMKILKEAIDTYPEVDNGTELLEEVNQLKTTKKKSEERSNENQSENEDKNLDNVKQIDEENETTDEKNENDISDENNGLVDEQIPNIDEEKNTYKYQEVFTEVGLVFYNFEYDIRETFFGFGDTVVNFEFDVYFDDYGNNSFELNNSFVLKTDFNETIWAHKGAIKSNNREWITLPIIPGDDVSMEMEFTIPNDSIEGYSFYMPISTINGLELIPLYDF